MGPACSRCRLEVADWRQLDLCKVCGAALCIRCGDEGCCGKKPADITIQRKVVPPAGPITLPMPEWTGRWGISRGVSVGPAPLTSIDFSPCCPRAKRAECSCEVKWVCPDHGEKHAGKHD
jgi:hypothetical protein